MTIFTLDKRGVLSVPAKALRFEPEGPLLEEGSNIVGTPSETRLWTKEGNTFTAHPVKVGISNGINTEIVSGITEGTPVITEATISQQGISAEMNGSSEKNPFMPGPPGSNKKK